MMKSILFTHDDLDGAGCRIIYELAHMTEEKGKDYTIINCGNSTVDEDVCQALLNAKTVGLSRETEIIFADIVAHNETLNSLKQGFDTVRIFDHHRTNFPAQQIIENAVIIPENDMGIQQSGTSLLWQYFNSIEVDAPGSFEILKDDYNQFLIGTFVDKVRSYDTYEWKETGDIEAKKLQTLFFMLGMERFCNRYVNLLSNKEASDLITDTDMEFVSSRLEAEQAVIDSITPDDVYQFDLRGFKTAFILGSKGANISELSHQFLSKYKDFDIFSAFMLGRRAEFSFRTVRDDIDTGATLAVPIGGGGHPKAAGAPLKDEYVEEIMTIIMKALNE